MADDPPLLAPAEFKDAVRDGGLDRERFRLFRHGETLVIRATKGGERDGEFEKEGGALFGSSVYFVSAIIEIILSAYPVW